MKALSIPGLRSAALAMLTGAACALAAAMLPGATAAEVSERDKADLARVEAYLNGIESLSAKFIQIAPDGGLSEGKLYLRRPGRLRFEYEEPSPVLVVADGLWMIFHDRELKQTTRVPLATTPLAVLLREKVSFGGPVAVRSVERGAGTLRVTVFDSAKPQEGQITLVFADQPLQLKQWVVTDMQGLNTNVALSQIDTNIYLKPELFVFYGDNPRDQTWR